MYIAGALRWIFINSLGVFRTYDTNRLCDTIFVNNGLCLLDIFVNDVAKRDTVVCQDVLVVYVAGSAQAKNCYTNPSRHDGVLVMETKMTFGFFFKYHEQFMYVIAHEVGDKNT